MMLAYALIDRHKKTNSDNIAQGGGGNFSHRTPWESIGEVIYCDKWTAERSH